MVQVLCLSHVWNAHVSRVKEGLVCLCSGTPTYQNERENPKKQKERSKTSVENEGWRVNVFQGRSKQTYTQACSNSQLFPNSWVDFCGCGPEAVYKELGCVWYLILWGGYYILKALICEIRFGKHGLQFRTSEVCLLPVLSPLLSEISTR